MANLGNHTPTRRTIRKVEEEIKTTLSHMEFAVAHNNSEALTVVQRNLVLLKEEHASFNKVKPTGKKVASSLC